MNVKTMQSMDAKQIANLRKRFGLPLHVVFLEEMSRNAMGFLQTSERLYPNMLVAFAAKSNPCLGAIRAIARLGLGLETASEYELEAGLGAGIPSNKMVCNGIAKSDRYLKMCVGENCLVVADNVDELLILNEMANRGNKVKARVLLRVVGMPLAGYTSASQSTASEWTKFGFSFQDIPGILRKVRSFEHLRFEGFSANIGAQICDPTAYDQLMDHLLELSTTAINLDMGVRRIDLGGGFPISFMSGNEWKEFTKRLREQLSGELSSKDWITWDNLPMGYGYLQGRTPKVTDPWIGKMYWSEFPGAAMLERVLTHKNGGGKTVVDRLKGIGAPKLIIEPGRSIVGTAGVTVTKALCVKKVLGHSVIILDMGINNHGTNLLAPDIFPVQVLPKRADDTPAETFLAGRLCFGGDMISMAKVRVNRLPERGDLVAIYCTGAYSADHFASNSCGFPRPAKVAMDECGEVDVWRHAEKFKDVFY